MNRPSHIAKKLVNASILKSGGPFIDHAFIAHRFLEWGGEMWKEHPVESVIVTEPYADKEEVNRNVEVLRKAGFKVWIRDFRWHSPHVACTAIIAADEVEIPSRVLQSSQVAGDLPVYDFLGFWPKGKRVVTEIYPSEPYQGESEEVGWSALRAAAA
jgi:hypothetical protein